VSGSSSPEPSNEAAADGWAAAAPTGADRAGWGSTRATERFEGLTGLAAFGFDGCAFAGAEPAVLGFLAASTAASFLLPARVPKSIVTTHVGRPPNVPPADLAWSEPMPTSRHPGDSRLARWGGEPNHASIAVRASILAVL
jgi:hypothetical protein